MMNVPFIISIIVHILFMVCLSFNINNPFSRKIEDKGYAVFEFKEIGEKSKAPVLSNEEGHVSKSKSQKRDKNDNKNVKKTIESEGMSAVNDKNDTTPIPAPDKPKKPQKDKKKSPTPKKNKKKSGKAVVNLQKNKKSSNKVDKNSKKKSFDSVLDSALATGDNENEGVKAEEVGEVLTATQIDLIRQTIRKCWHFPAGLKNAEELAVDIKMELMEDGTVKSAEIVDKARMQSDPDFKIAAENAYRAVLDPECNPLPLPKEKYNEWKDLELTFNPKDMF